MTRVPSNSTCISSGCLISTSLRVSYLFFKTIIRYRKLYYLTYVTHIESLMSCHLLLNLLHELANEFLPTNVINLVINDNEIEILFIT